MSAPVIGIFPSAPTRARALLRVPLVLTLLSSCAAPGDRERAGSEAPAPPIGQEAPADGGVDGTAVVGTTQAIAALAGRFSVPAPSQERIRFYATDLGWAFPHGDELWLLFGDSWVNGQGFPLGLSADDAVGKISLRDFPDGDSVERWIAAHPPADLRVPWRAPAPPVAMVTDARGRVPPLRQVRAGQALTSGVALTPVAGFSNARRDASAGAFGIFIRNEHLQCSARGTCSDGFSCDAQLGRCAPLNDLSSACVVGSSTCRCVAVGTGLCIDKGSSLYDGSTERGRANAAVIRHQVGNALSDDPATFITKNWATHRFFNPTVHTVDDFDPTRLHGAGNDYAPADGIDPEREGVFVWGRPNFGGVGAQGRDAQLYLAWVPMPAYDRDGNFSWEPRHFAGFDEQGLPRFSSREVDGVPLDLDASTEGMQPEEVHDLVGQMAISWLPSVGRFVMMYGGDLSPAFVDLIFGPDGQAVRRSELGAIFIRFAEHPWGPWTAPRTLIAAGDLERGDTHQYGPGGILHHPRCAHPTCAPSEPVFASKTDEHGRLYAPSIIAPWTEVRDDGSVDLYWNLSTWNPYQVVLMKTHLTPSDLTSR